MYTSVKEIARKWNLSERRVRVLCSEGKISGAYQNGRIWSIPKEAQKPSDARYKTQMSLFINKPEIELKKDLLSTKRKLTDGEINRINFEFIVEYTFHSNAIFGNKMSLEDITLILNGFDVENISVKDKIKIISHKSSYDFILYLSKNDINIDEEIIKQIHSILLFDSPIDAGTYRRIPIKDLILNHTPTMPNLIEYKMKKLIKDYIESDEDIVSKITKFHLDFILINPFIELNYQCAFLLTNFELIKLGYPPIYIDFNERENYLTALKKYIFNGSINEMKKIIEKKILERLDWYLEILKE